MARNAACEMNFTKLPNALKTARLIGYGAIVAYRYARASTRLRGL